MCYALPRAGKYDTHSAKTSESIKIARVSWLSLRVVALKTLSHDVSVEIRTELRFSAFHQDQADPEIEEYLIVFSVTGMASVGTSCDPTLVFFSHDMETGSAKI